MSNVSLEIAGRHYKVACPEGEEDHIRMLGASIDSKIAALPGMSSQSESRTLLYAVLMLADELHEAGKRAEPAQIPPQPDPQPAQEPTLQLGEPLENMAVRLESLASLLESGPANT